MKICIVGLGTIGSYISMFISDSIKLKELIIVDYDIVELKNLKNTVYNKNHIGKLKVDVVDNIIREINDKVIITKINEEYIEGKTQLPEYDYIFDCRDFIYDRKDIDVRLYFTGRHLIIDCRKSIVYRNHEEGRYLSNLSKNDVIGAASSVVALFRDGTIDRLIKNKCVYRHMLDTSNMDASEFINEKITSPDIIYEGCSYKGKHEDVFINLHDNISKIFDMQLKQDVKIYIGSIDNPVEYKCLSKSTLNSFSDVIQYLLASVNLPISHDHYIVHVGNGYVELIPETGAA